MCDWLYIASNIYIYTFVLLLCWPAVRSRRKKRKSVTCDGGAYVYFHRAHRLHSHKPHVYLFIYLYPPPLHLYNIMEPRSFTSYIFISSFSSSSSASFSVPSHHHLYSFLQVLWTLFFLLLLFFNSPVSTNAVFQTANNSLYIYLRPTCNCLLSLGQFQLGRSHHQRIFQKQL